MKIKTNSVDSLAYITLVIITLGSAWALRVIISYAIRCVFAEGKQ